MSERNSTTELQPIGETLRAAAARLVGAQRHALLIIEDTAAHAAIIRRALDEAVWEVEHVTRGEDALRSFTADCNRMVLLDLSLPDSDGLEVLKKLRLINPETPVIVVTANEQLSVSVSAMQQGAWDYVLKAEPKETARQISSALDRAWRMRLRAAETALIKESRITELIRAERLSAAENLIAKVTVEINNPLSALLAYTQLLQQKENLEEGVRRLIEGIERSAAQIADAVQKLKTVEPEDNRSSIAPSPD